MAAPALAVLLGAVLAAREAPPTPRPQAATTPPDTTIMVYTTGPNLAFEPERISVKAGTTVRIQYVNEGVFAHNLVVVKKEEDIDVIGAAAHTSPDFVPKQHSDRMIAFTPLASQGKTVEVTFTAPPAGDYPFACMVDGHHNVMVGLLRSRP